MSFNYYVLSDVDITSLLSTVISVQTLDSIENLNLESLKDCTGLIVYNSDGLRNNTINLDIAILKADSFDMPIHCIGHSFRWNEFLKKNNNKLFHNYKTLQEFIDKNKKGKGKQESLETESSETEESYKKVAMICSVALFEQSFPIGKFKNTVQLDLTKIEDFFSKYNVDFEDMDKDICSIIYTIKHPPRIKLA